MSEAQLPVHVEVLGPEPSSERPTFLLLHGYGASGFTWRRWAPRLAALGHVVQLDLKGFGRAPKPDDGRYGPTDQAEIVRRLIEKRDLPNITLFGHSLGGGIALLVALDLLADGPSSRLQRLVIVSGAAYEQRLPPFVTMAEWPRLSTLLLRLVGMRMVVAAALRMVVHDPGTVTGSMIRGYAEPLGSPDAVRALIAAARQIVPPDLPELTRRYPEIRVPTLLLWGRQDRVVLPGVGQRLAHEVPDARLHILEKCGHLPPEEAPEESFALLADFLSETSDAQQPYSTTADPAASTAVETEAFSPYDV